ncbi:hypothetical protein BLOT_012806 [Blomia tropicalis]|nr:hypothetical protein BLOT_012806 [Blomia tropicalis]
MDGFVRTLLACQNYVRYGHHGQTLPFQLINCLDHLSINLMTLIGGVMSDYPKHRYHCSIWAMDY